MKRIAPNAFDFIGRQQVAIISTLDASARVVCSALVGEPGAFEVIDPMTLSLESRAGIVGDAFSERTRVGSPIGILFVGVATRRRYRVNGTVIGADEERILVRAAEAYPDCPKYIQRRALHLTDDRSAVADIREGVDLEPEQQELIACADTFFIASAGPDRNLDASHRGGRPGFVGIDGDRLWIPDYHGNNMYNTLGNVSVNPTTGLLFIDFESGDTLQLSGVADIDLEAIDAATGGTNRAWTFTTTSIVAPAFRWCATGGGGALLGAGGLMHLPGDAVEFERFVIELRPRLVRAFAGCRGPADASDAAAEALAYAFENWDRVRMMENPGGYLYRVGCSRTRPRRRPQLPAPHDVGVPDVEPALIKSLLALPESQRTAVWLVHACQWHYTEVAEAMSTSVSMVGNHVSRGLAALRRQMKVEIHA